MDSAGQLDHELRWTPSEKKAARRAYDKAFELQCAAITKEVKRMLQKMSNPGDIWRIEEYLYEKRKEVDRLFQFSYSRLILVFSILMRDGWMTDADLAGLDQEKIDRIKRFPRY